ncbi:hypothetical protein QBC46DRAFT_399478 [Diplogelasinospora grovesii]|uniref:Heterokaryon incompatibility domain-containing protein n=1 Tax=Diplogelasinospora grovesii TaxID=303347 RepID=A0AAN6RZT9_9PEZI|nr:hypothetical protein QBC46DRAFT_399478 [Diplogelasinospora grovesii]
MWRWKDTRGIQYVADLVLGVRSGQPDQNEALQRLCGVNELRRMPSTDLLAYRWLPRASVANAVERVLNTFNRGHMKEEAKWLSPNNPSVWRQHLTMLDGGSMRVPDGKTMVFAGLDEEGPRQTARETPPLMLSHSCLRQGSPQLGIGAVCASISEKRVATVFLLNDGVVLGPQIEAARGDGVWSATSGGLQMLDFLVWAVPWIRKEMRLDASDVDVRLEEMDACFYPGCGRTRRRAVIGGVMGRIVHGVRPTGQDATPTTTQLAFGAFELRPSKRIPKTGSPLLNIMVDVPALGQIHRLATSRAWGKSKSVGAFLHPAHLPDDTLEEVQRCRVGATAAVRLLDLDTGHVVQAEGKAYFAISYVWAMLSDAEAVPLLMQLGQELGLRYAWIDRLCIDQKSTVDKLQQLPVMGKIYVEAAVTVVLMNDIDSHGLSLAETRESVFSHPWWSRGWTFQEGLMARMSVIRLKGTWMQAWQLEGKESPWNWMDTNLECNAAGTCLKYSAPNALVPWAHMRIALGHLAAVVEADATKWLHAMASRKFTLPQDRLYGMLGLLPPSITARIPVSYAISEAQIIGNFVAAGLMGAECLLGSSASHSTEPGRCWLPETIENMIGLSKGKMDWEMSLAGDMASLKGLLIENVDDTTMNLKADGQHDSELALWRAVARSLGISHPLLVLPGAHAILYEVEVVTKDTLHWRSGRVVWDQPGPTRDVCLTWIVGAALAEPARCLDTGVV